MHPENAYAARMRWALPLLFVAALAAWPAGALAEASEPRVLVTVGDDVAQVNHALMAISQGDSGPLEALPPTLFSEPIGWTDDRNPDVVRRWTALIPRATAKLTAQQRDQLMRSLEASLRAGMPKDPTARLAAALDHLPAHLAREIVARAASLAFDRGDMRTFLALDSLLLGGAEDRRPIAEGLLARGETIDPSIELTAPGALVATDTPPAPDDGGVTVIWRTSPGWLLACDPCGRVLWQYAVEPNAETVCGAYAAVTRGKRGLRLIDERGSVSSLPAMPVATRILCVAGGAAWFAANAAIFRYDLAGADITSFALPDTPVGAPIVRGTRSLWLGPRELFLFDRDQLIHRFAHGLPVDASWRLADGNGQVCLVGGGKAYRFEPFADQIAKAKPLERMRLYTVASRFEDALHVFAADEALRKDPQARALALRGRLALGKFKDMDDCAILLSLAGTPQDELMARFQIGMHLTEHGPEPELEKSSKALAGFAAAHPDLEIPRDPREFAGKPASWTRVMTGAGVARMLAGPGKQPWPKRCDPTQPVQDESRPAAAADQPRNDGTNHHYLGLIIHVDPVLGSTRVQASDEATGAPLWRTRWQAPLQLDAPNRNVAFSDDHLLVGEGRDRVTAVNLQTGDVTAFRLTGTEVTGARLVLLDRGLAALTPPGIYDRLTLAGADGPSRQTRLPDRARWIARAPGNAVIVQLGAEAMLHDGQEPATVQLPDALRNAAEVTGTPEGLLADDRLFRWK